MEEETKLPEEQIISAEETPQVEETQNIEVVEETPNSEVAEEVQNVEVVEETPSIEVVEEIQPQEVVIEEAPSTIETPIVPQEDFDWEAYEKGDIQSKSEKKHNEELYEQTLTAVKDKEVVEGTVISINKREVVVNIGSKQDGVIAMSEFRYNPELAVGDKVEVYIDSLEDKHGELLLSHKQARQSRSWDRVNEALESQEIVKGFVKCRTKGGMIVDVFGIEAFLPGSQIDVKPIKDYDIFVGHTMEFKVIKINNEFRNVVVSHKALIEAELELQKKEIMKGLQIGQVLEGEVKNITSYGVFIDLGGVDGLIHITDLSYGRINHPEEIVQIGQKLNVVIISFNEEMKRIALGLKQLAPHPWESLDPNLKVGDKLKGKVVVLTDYGAFIEIAPGVEGLVHVSEMTWAQHIRSVQDLMKVGDEIECVILTLDKEERKMSLGIKQLTADPWETVEERYSIGSKHNARVRNFTNFGVFVEIEEGVDGLIHISDLSWTKKIKHPSEFTQIGAEIEVQVLDIDKTNRRLSLGHKQLEDNPWDVLESVFKSDSIHEGVVAEILDKGAIITLPYGVEGFVTTKQLAKEDGSNAKVGEQLPFKVVEFNKDSKRIILSHNRVWEDVKRSENPEEPSEGEKKVVRKTKKEEPAATQVMEKTTLGDIQELADLKENLVKEAVKKMEKAEKTKADKAKKDKEAAAAVAAETTEIAETTTEPAPAKATKPAKESKKAKESEVAVEGETPKKKSTKKSAETSASAEKTEN